MGQESFTPQQTIDIAHERIANFIVGEGIYPPMVNIYRKSK